MEEYPLMYLISECQKRIHDIESFFLYLGWLLILAYLEFEIYIHNHKVYYPEI